MVFQGEIVAASVTSRELGVNSAQSVQGLVDIAKIVDEQSQCIGLRSCLIVIVIIHNGGVGVTLLVVSLAREPVDNIRDVLRDIVHVLLKGGVILKVAALVKVRNVDEVPVGLPAAALVLDLIGEGCALHERVASLAVCDGLTGHG